MVRINDCPDNDMTEAVVSGHLERNQTKYCLGSKKQG